MSHVARILMLVGLVSVLSGGLQPAEAQVSDKVSLMLKLSIDPSVGGTAIGAASGAVNGVPVSIQETSWTDTHSKESPLFEAGVGIRAGRLVEVLGLFNYGRAGATGNAIGEIGGVPLQASFDNYQFWGMEGGVRLRGASGVGPYAAFTGGFRHVSDMQVRLVANTSVTQVTAYQASTVPSVSLGGGMLWGDAGFAMGFEVGLRYAGSPAGPAGQSVESAPGAGARWSLPVGIVLRF